MLLSVTFLSGCGKDDSVLFKDNSTAKITDRSTWTATANSESATENTGKASAVLDGDINTIWHTSYAAGNSPVFPHWLLIDMKEDKKLISVLITNRQAATPNARGIKNFELFGSKDGTNFTSLGKFVFKITNASQPFAVSSTEAVRYLKLIAYDSQLATQTVTFLSEIDVVVEK